MRGLELIKSTFFGVFLVTCSVPGQNTISPLVGTCDEFSYDKQTSVGRYVTLPIRGQIMASAHQILIDIRSTSIASGYSVLFCKGQQYKKQNQELVAVDLTCHDGSFGTGFINLISDKNGYGGGQFSLSNGTHGNFEFGYRLLLNSQT